MSTEGSNAIMNYINSCRFPNGKQTSNRHEYDVAWVSQYKTIAILFSTAIAADKPVSCLRRKGAYKPQTASVKHTLWHSEVGNILSVCPVGFRLPTSCHVLQTSDSQNLALLGAHQNQHFNLSLSSSLDNAEEDAKTIQIWEAIADYEDRQRFCL